MDSWTIHWCFFIQGGPKVRPLYIFANIQQYIFPNIKTPTLWCRSASRIQERQELCLWNRGQGQQSVLVMRRFLAKGYYCICAKCGHYKWTLQQDSVRRLTPPEAINVKMSFIEPNMTLWPPNNPDLNPVEYSVWGVLQEMIYHCRSFKSVQELRSAISRCVATTVTSVPWTEYQRMAASPWKRSAV